MSSPLKCRKDAVKLAGAPSCSGNVIWAMDGDNGRKREAGSASRATSKKHGLQVPKGFVQAQNNLEERDSLGKVGR